MPEQRPMHRTLRLAFLDRGSDPALTVEAFRSAGRRPKRPRGLWGVIPWIAAWPTWGRARPQ